MADYRTDHLAPGIDYGKPICDLSQIYPEDFYSKNGWRWYGDGIATDRLAVQILQKAKGNPGMVIKIYRAVPEGVDAINPGDWITTVRGYAVEHGERYLGKFVILEMDAVAKNIYTDGNSIHEFGFLPD